MIEQIRKNEMYSFYWLSLLVIFWQDNSIFFYILLESFTFIFFDWSISWNIIFLCASSSVICKSAFYNIMMYTRLFFLRTSFIKTFKLRLASVSQDRLIYWILKVFATIFEFDFTLVSFFLKFFLTKAIRTSEPEKWWRI